MRQDCICHSFLPRVVVVDVMHIICECTNDETKKDDDEMIPSINRRRREREMPHLSLSLYWRGARRRKRTVDRPMITSSSREWQLCRCAPLPLVTPIRSLRNITIRKLEVGRREKKVKKIHRGKMRLSRATRSRTNHICDIWIIPEMQISLGNSCLIDRVDAELIFRA